MGSTSGTKSLDELAKLNTTPASSFDFYLDYANRKGAVRSDTNNDGMTDLSFIDSLASRNIMDLWGGQVGATTDAIISQTADGKQKVEGQWENDSNDLFMKLMPVIVGSIATMGFGAGIAGAMGVESGTLGAAAINAGVGSAMNAAETGSFDVGGFFKNLAIKSLFQGGGKG